MPSQFSRGRPNCCSSAFSACTGQLRSDRKQAATAPSTPRTSWSTSCLVADDSTYASAATVAFTSPHVKPASNRSGQAHTPTSPSRAQAPRSPASPGMRRCTLSKSTDPPVSSATTWRQISFRRTHDCARRQRRWEARWAAAARSRYSRSWTEPTPQPAASRAHLARRRSGSAAERGARTGEVINAAKHDPAVKMMQLACTRIL